MAFTVYQKTPKGSAKNYIDVNTSEIISARQYRNRKANATSKPTLYDKAKKRSTALGFATPYAQKKAAKPEKANHPKVGTQHRAYNIGLPLDLERAIATVIGWSGTFGFGMYATALVESEDGKRYISTTVFKKTIGMITTMIDDIKASLISYQLTFRILNWTIDIIAELPKITISKKAK